MSGALVAIFLIDRAGGAPRSVTEVRAVPGHGLEGDRYFGPRTKRPPGPTRLAPERREVTLIEQEAIDAVLALEPGAARRNLVTRGVALNDLVGVDFTIGTVRLRGHELCHPCTRLAKFSSKAVMVALRGRGGLRAEILDEGVLHVGDPLAW